MPTRRAKEPRRAQPGPSPSPGRLTGAVFALNGVGARFWHGGVEIRGATKVILNDRRPPKPGMKDLNRPAPLPGCRIAPPQHGKN